MFGSKFVQLVPPPDPSPTRMYSGQVVNAGHVTVEINTVFQQLVSVLNKIDPAKLNETLGAIAKAFNGRGEKIGQTLTDFDRLLAKLDPSLPNLQHDIEVFPAVANTYADASDDLVRTANNAASISRTIVDEQQNLDALLISATGLADIGNEVIGDNRQGLSDAVHAAAPDHLAAGEVSREHRLRSWRHHPVRHLTAAARARRHRLGELPARYRAVPLPTGSAEGQRQARPADL